MTVNYRLCLAILSFTCLIYCPCASNFDIPFSEDHASHFFDALKLKKDGFSVLLSPTVDCL